MQMAMSWTGGIYDMTETTEDDCCDELGFSFPT